MKLIVPWILSLVFAQSVLGTHLVPDANPAKASDHTSALIRYLFDNYEKDAKPDGQVTVKYGVHITDLSLCPHKQVSYGNWKECCIQQIMIFVH